MSSRKHNNGKRPDDSEVRPSLYDPYGVPILTTNSRGRPPSNKAASIQSIASLRWIRTPRALVVFSVSLVSLAAAVSSFIPWIRVEAFSAYDKMHPFRELFTISNLSPVPLRSVEIFCSYPLLHFHQLDGRTLDGYGNPELFGSYDVQDVSLPPYGQNTFSCPPPIIDLRQDTDAGVPVELIPERIRLIIKATFHPWFMRWISVTRIQQFDSRRDVSGNLVWYPVSEWNPPQPPL